MSLQWIGQDDFGAGTLLGIAQDHEIGIGVEQMLNGLIDDGGDIVRRGAVTRLGAAPAPAALTFVWSGYLADNYVELVATASRMYAVSPTGVLTDLGPPGLTEPCQPAIVADVLFLPNGFTWGGSLKTATYSTGTVNLFLNDSIVTGVGTGWSAANVEPGMFFEAGGLRARIHDVLSATQIVLDQTPTASASGLTYTIKGSLPDGFPGHLGVAAGRLLTGDGSYIYFSKSGDPFSFNGTDFHKLPDGVHVVGFAGIRDQALVFTNYGLWSINNMAFDLTDDFGNPQQTMSRLTPEVALLHEAGLAEWAGRIVVPCIDRIFLVDGMTPPVPIGDSIANLYTSYVRQGYRPGGARIYRDHYLLPILNTAKQPIALLVCRINRPFRSRQVWYPWSQFDGYPAGIGAFDVDLRTTPQLRGVHKDGWRVDLTAAFPPFTGSNPAIDPDGKAPIFDVQTRDLPTGDQRQPNHFRRLRLWYDSLGDGTVQPAFSFGAVYQRYQDITGRTYGAPPAVPGSNTVFSDFANYEAMYRGVSVDPDDIKWSQGARYWNVLDKRDLPEPGFDPIMWSLSPIERERYVRVRFRSEDGVGQIKLRKIDIAVRPTNHTR